MAELTSRRPYLIRALYDWVLDNDLTPHLLVAADAEGVNVPRQFVTEDGKITVNVSPGAVRGLSLGNDLVSFSARFSGRSYEVSLPPGAVLALYARENGEGMLFGEVETAATAQPRAPPTGRNRRARAAAHRRRRRQEETRAFEGGEVGGRWPGVDDSGGRVLAVGSGDSGLAWRSVLVLALAQSVVRWSSIRRQRTWIISRCIS